MQDLAVQPEQRVVEVCMISAAHVTGPAAHAGNDTAAKKDAGDHLVWKMLNSVAILTYSSGRCCNPCVRVYLLISSKKRVYNYLTCPNSSYDVPS
jgi:hypothetical protein